MKKRTSVHPQKSRVTSKEDFMSLVNEKFIHFDAVWYYLAIGKRPKKAVTIKDPYAHLACINMLDSVEMAHKTNYRGYVWIHSAKTPGVADEELKQKIKKDIVMRTMAELSGRALGAIIGCAELVDCVPHESGNGKWKYIFHNAVYFKFPIENVSGKSMIWEYGGDIPRGECLLKRNQSVFKTAQLKYDEVQKMKTEPKKDNSFAGKVKRDTELMIGRLSKDEILKVSFLPLILSEFALHYAELARTTAAQMKLERMKKLSRELQKYTDVYESSKIKFLDKKHRDRMMQHFRMCLDLTEYDRTVLYYTVSNELKKVSSEIPYEEVRIYAIISSLFTKIHKELIEEIDKLASEKMPESELKEGSLPQDVAMIDKLMYQYAGVDEVFDYDASLLKIGIKAIYYKVEKEKFNFIEYEEK